jgi:hypothetical protein
MNLLIKSRTLLFTLLSLTSCLLNAAQIVFEQKEVLGKDWSRKLLSYQVEFGKGEARDGQFTLKDSEGNLVPVQVDVLETHSDDSIRKAVVRFYAELPLGTTMRFVLNTNKEGSPTPTRAVHAVMGNDEPVSIANSFTSVMFPKSQPQLQNPKSLQEVPGPLKNFRLANGMMTGGSRFPRSDNAPESTRVKGFETRLVSGGPLYAEVSVRYELVGGGHIETRVGLEAEAPVILMNEEIDTKLIGSPLLYMEYLLSGDSPSSWQPDVVYARSGRPAYESDAGLEEQFSKAGIELPKARKGSQKISAMELGNQFNLNVANRWSTASIFGGFVRKKDLVASPKERPFVGVVPLHAGKWRNGQYQEGFAFALSQLPNKQLAARLPLTAPARRGSYLHTGEYDTTLPASMVRRNWAIAVGPIPDSFQALWDLRMHHGYLTLDDYKDWQLEWKEDPKVSYPRLFFTKQDLIKAKQMSSKNPYEEELLSLDYLNEDPTVAQKLAEKAIRGSRYPRGYASHLLTRGGYMGLPWVSGFHQANYVVRWTIPAEIALTNLKLEPGLRKQVRQQLAALAYAASEPDLTRRGGGVHQGNPNMPIRRFLALPFLAALIPDHPRAKEWLTVSAQFMEWKLQTMVAPKGDWGEPGRYLNASLPYFIQAAIILENAGYLSEKTAKQCGAVAYEHSNFLTPPDSRFEGRRIVPSLGHGSQIDYFYAFANAILLRNSDPEKTKDLAWVWHAMGKPTDANGKSHREGYDLYKYLLPVYGHLLGDEKIVDSAKRRARVVNSRWHPGWGAVMRAHAGDPNETYMAYRQGFMVSHADPNQGDFVIHAKGTPLTPSSKAHYLLHNTGRGDWGGTEGLYATQGDHFCRIRFGKPEYYGGQPGGGAESNVNEYFSGESVDYLRGWGVYDDTNKWATPKAEWTSGCEGGPIHWDRQVLFLKGKTASGPNYFVLRDTFSGNTKQDKFWHLRTAVHPEKIKKSPRGFTVHAENGTRLHATFLLPEKVQAKFISGRDLDTVCTAAQVKAGSSQTEYFSVLYPGLPNEKQPKLDKVADGVLKSQTSEGTDYVFLGGESTLSYQDEELAFKGRSGAIRLTPKSVHFVLSTADGEGSLTYKGLTCAGIAPFEKVVPIDKVKKTMMLQMPAPKYSIQYHDRKLKQSGEGIVFEGSSGGVEVKSGNSARLVLGPGRGKVGFNGFRVWGEGPFEIKIVDDGVEGITEGRERFIYMNRPSTLKGIPALWIDGVGSAPGYQGNLAIPVFSGKHEIKVSEAKQPDLFR